MASIQLRLRLELTSYKTLKMSLTTKPNNFANILSNSLKESMFVRQMEDAELGLISNSRKTLKML